MEHIKKKTRQSQRGSHSSKHKNNENGMDSKEKQQFLKSPSGRGPTLIVPDPPTDISAITSVSISHQSRRLQSRVDAVKMRLEDVDSPGTPVALSQPLLDDS